MDMDSNPFIATIASAYASIQEFLFANIAGPILYQFDLMSMAEDVFDGIDWFLFGCIQILWSGSKGSPSGGPT